MLVVDGSRNADYRWRCRGCKKMFTVRTGTIFEESRPGTDIHSNTIEGVFSLIKRGVMGTFHSVSRKHLANYLNEFEFRWNTRKLDDGQRVSKAIRQVQGKRLEYRESADNPPYRPAITGQMDSPFQGGK